MSRRLSLSSALNGLVDSFILRETNVVLKFVGGLVIWYEACAAEKRARPGGARS